VSKSFEALADDPVKTRYRGVAVIIAGEQYG
jgi:hypothetical protein